MGAIAAAADEGAFTIAVDGDVVGLVPRTLRDAVGKHGTKAIAGALRLTFANELDIAGL